MTPSQPDQQLEGHAFSGVDALTFVYMTWVNQVPIRAWWCQKPELQGNGDVHSIVGLPRRLSLPRLAVYSHIRNF